MHKRQNKTYTTIKRPNYSHQNVEFNILGIGRPRSGTGYAHMLLRKFGLDVGHECIRPDGCVDWQLSFRSRVKKPYGDGSLDFFKRGLVIRNTRNPLNSIPSFVKRVVEVPPALKYIQANLDLNLDGLNSLEKSIDVMYAFEELLDTWVPDCVFKIETEADKLYQFLSKHYDDLLPFDQKSVDKLKFYNGDTYGVWMPELLQMRDSLKQPYINKINNICKKLGYPSIFDRSTDGK